MRSSLLSLAVGLSAMQANALRIGTYNLRYDSKPDNITVAQSLASLPDPLQAVPYLAESGEQPWSTRRLHIAEQILGENVSLFGELSTVW